jgi:hypothetical protein
VKQGPLNRSDVLKLRQEAVARSEALLKSVRKRDKGARARHNARLQLQRDRRALQALEGAMNGQH